MRYLLLLLLLLPLVSGAQFTYERSNDPQLVNKCFFEPVDFQKYTAITRQAEEETPSLENTTPSPTDELLVDELVYGQVLDDNGDPLGGVTVRIIWQEFDEEKSFTTTTLTQQGAVLFGDERFEGYYFFSRARIGGANYRVELVEEESPPITTEPSPQENPLPEVTKQPVSVPRVSDELLPPEPSRFLAFLNKYIGLLLFLIVAFGLILLYQLRLKKHVKAFMFRPPRVSRSVNKLHKQLVRSFMLTEYPVIDVEASFRELLTKVVQEAYCLVEKEGRFLGMITAEDLLKPLYRDGDKEIRKYVKHPHTLTINTPFSRAAMLASEYRVFPVVKNGVAVGVVTRHQLLSMYDELFSLNPSATRKVAKLQHAIVQAVTISPKESVAHLIEEMIAHDTSTIVILEDKPLGIITELNVLEELMDYRDTLDQMTVQSFGSSLSTVEATASLLDANRILLDARLRALPVTHKGSLVGVLTERSAITELQAALKEYS